MTLNPSASEFNSDLPSVQNAQLPDTYAAAKQALAKCQDIDECQTWANKSAALASYAKQANDETLLKMATRIKARAVRRSGELLKQIEPSRGHNLPNIERTVDHTIGRTAAAREAGMSKHQQTQALRVANVPENDFEQQVESDTPKTVTEFARQGTKPRQVLDLNGRDPGEFNRALHFVGDFERFAKDLSEKNINADCPILIESERVRLRKAINQIDQINDAIMTRI